jgi:uncharacterized protein YaaN involved in tellurite resistance
MDENNNGIQLDASAFSTDLMAAEVPTLTFGEPEPEAPVVALEAPKPQIEAPKDEDILTEAERRQVDALAKQINLRDTNGILQYGAGTQKKMSDFSDAALATVKTRDLGEVGEMLSGVINNLEEFDPNEKEEGGFFGLFKKPKKKLDDIKVQYDKANVNVEKVAKALQEHQVVLMKDIATLDKMYASNLIYYKELTMYILAGKKAIENLKNGELAELRAKAERSGLSEDAQAVRDLEDQINRFEKKIHDLELTRTIAIQTAPQIRLIQSADTMMVEKIQSTIVNTIPLWKNQMVIAIGIEHANQAARAEREVNDMTNALLRKNAEKLKQATVETAKEAERGIVDIETLKHTNEMLISTMDEVMAIQAEGKQKRAAAEKDLAQIEQQLREKLLQASRG